jgi:hypothetical protein
MIKYNISIIAISWLVAHYYRQDRALLHGSVFNSFFLIKKEFKT